MRVTHHKEACFSSMLHSHELGNLNLPAEGRANVRVNSNKEDFNLFRNPVIRQQKLGCEVKCALFKEFVLIRVIRGQMNTMFT